MGDLAEALAQAGHSVHLLTDVPVAAAADLGEVSVETPHVPVGSGQLADAGPESALDDLMYASAVYREVRRIHEEDRPVDAVLAPLWRSEGAVCMLDDRFPTIVSCMTSLRTLTEVDDSSRLAPGIAERLSLEREALARSRYLHGLTDAVLSKTIRDHDLRPDATAVIGRGLHDRSDPELRHAQGTGPLRVLFVGRIERRKGVDTLLAAARELVAERAAVRFTIVGAHGDPTYRDLCQRMVSESPEFGDRVRFVGAVADPELDRLYAESDIVCAPSRYESHGVVLIEAMMFGKSIVTCDAGGIGEVVDAGGNALLSPPEDAGALAASLRRLAADSVMRTEMGLAARKAYEQRFDARAIARRMQSFMEDVVALHSHAGAAAGDIETRLQKLLEDSLVKGPDAACALAHELLHPHDAVTVRRLRAAAQAAPAPPPSASAAQVSALVVTRDRPGLLRSALDSLELAGTPPRTIVIDNDSTPAMAWRVAAECAGRPHAELRRSDRNLSRAEGRRLGAELIETPMVLLLGDDAELLPGALEHLAAELDAHPGTAAVTATILTPDGIIQHSGGSLELGDEIATFGLIGAGSVYAPDALPPTGPAGWVPSTAMLVRRELLQEFVLDERMAAYEDSEWCYRVSLTRPCAFRRSREALVLHHRPARQFEGSGPRSGARAIELLAACARFYERHGLLLGPWLSELVPELRSADGTCDLAGARVLMELLLAKGPAWTSAAWTDGTLSGLLSAGRRQADLRSAEAALERAREGLESQEEAIAYLRRRNETLCRIEQGGWWRLRARVLPALRLAGWLREQRRGAPAPMGQDGPD
jgi:glycosyltransferase involved in cell wall biosynthesis/GT2 family glycosyltransferase